MRHTLLLERGPHREQRESRERIRNRVDEERKRPGEPEERASERRSCEPHHCLPARFGSRGCRELARRHNRTQGAGLSTEEQGGAAAFDERNGHDFPEGDAVEQDRRGEARDREHAHGVGRDHQPSAAPAVGRQSGGQCEKHRWKAARERDDAGLGGRVRDREHEPREQLPDLQQHEVAVSAQRDRCHAATLADLAGTSSMFRPLQKGHTVGCGSGLVVALVDQLAVRRRRRRSGGDRLRACEP